MKSKPYIQHEEPSTTAAEPAVAYQRTDSTTYPNVIGANHRSCEQEELAKLEEEWLRPFTMEELHRRMDEAEAEAEVEAGLHQRGQEQNRDCRPLGHPLGTPSTHRKYPIIYEKTG